MKKRLVAPLMTLLPAVVFASPASAHIAGPSSRVGRVVQAAPGQAEPGTPASIDDATRRENSVRRLYLAYFLRDGDPGGITYWTKQYAAGRPLVAISEHFARSKEFQDRYGQVDDDDFVELVYGNVFDRSADPSGSAYWTAQLRKGRTRGSFMVAMSESTEFKRITALP